MSKATYEHPLFPEDESKDYPPLPGIDAILVYRHERGRLEAYPGSFQPDELTGLESLYERWGGGRYEVVARFAGKIAARRAYDFAGPAKPFAPPAPDVPPSFVMPQSAGGGGPGFLGIAMALGPIVVPLIQSMLQSSATRDSLMQQALIGMMQQQVTNAGAAANQTVQVMAQLHEQTLQRMQSRDAAGSGGGGIDSFYKGVQFMQGQVETMLAKAKGDGDEDMVKQLGEIATVLGPLLSQFMPSAATPATVAGASA